MMVDKFLAWKYILSNAHKAMISKLIYHSIIEHKKYQVIGCEETKIIISRLSGGNNDNLTRTRVFDALDRFNQANGVVQRRQLISPTVAKETTLVILCPYLAWDSSGEFIFEVK